MDQYSTISIFGFWPWCWWCGRDEQHAPRDWHGPWLLERAHIGVQRPRLEDRRAVVLLCSRCHRLEQGQWFDQTDVAVPTVGNMLWLKRTFDREFFDLQFLECKTSKAARGGPWVSVPFTASLPRLRKQLTHLGEISARRGVKVICGGQAINDETLIGIKNLTYPAELDSLTELTN